MSSNYASQNPVQPLSESLKHIRFPISRKDLLRQYGMIRIQLVHGQILTLEDALRDIIQPEFRSISDLMVAVGENRRADEAKDW